MVTISKLRRENLLYQARQPTFTKSHILFGSLRLRDTSTLEEHHRVSAMAAIFD